VIILGAGLAGCLAGALERDATIFEAGPGVGQQHKAVLRFRDDKISRALGIPFRAVRVTKAIWSEGREYDWCSPRHANQYALKVIGRPSVRSILNLAPADRFIGPDNLHEQLAARCAGRIHWDHKITHLDAETLNTEPRKPGEPIVSTLPLTVLHAITGTPLTEPLKFAGITVERWDVPGSDVHQTVYFPDPANRIYRATLSGELMILEGMSPPRDNDRADVMDAFGLSAGNYDILSTDAQRYGKIQPLPAERRKKLLLDFTVRFNLFALGRFATWRNILLDDCYDDLFKIRSMIGLGFYDLMRETLA
jgi:hypothetical protein